MKLVLIVLFIILFNLFGSESALPEACEKLPTELFSYEVVNIDFSEGIKSANPQITRIIPSKLVFATSADYVKDSNPISLINEFYGLFKISLIINPNLVVPLVHSP